MLINKKFNLVEQGGLIPQLPFPHIYINDFFVDSSICEKAKIEFINFNKWDGEKIFMVAYVKSSAQIMKIFQNIQE